MLVKEIRNELEKYDKKDLEKIIIELYKRIPKSKKEDYEIDEFIKNCNADSKKVQKELSFNDLIKEIEYFLSCVDLGYYYCSNKIISKKERSTWRFKVKRYYKELIKSSPDTPEGDVATNLLIEIFKRLSIGSNTLLFSNWETFRAVSISQAEYYDMLFNRIIYSGYTKENLLKCINLLDFPKDPYELSIVMYLVFVFNLKTVDTKEMAIALFDDKVINLKKELKNCNSRNKYDYESDINDIVEAVFDIYITLSEYDGAIEYFNKNYISNELEVKQYVLLEMLDRHKLVSYWIREYEKYLGKVKYRNYLNERYKELKVVSN